ncbi:MAG TPA: tRNA pseudouridine(55) synthase TruB [Frankiaceae bacterium]|nr:tRNA pseudouridine(55) synthase TruB [Frankiaceae bacterium]
MKAPAEPVAGGLVIVDKPGGLTSHDVVARLRRIARTRRVGHAGTLDPAATGVLVCGVGRATRLLGHLLHAGKEYEATIQLGVRTSTDDAEGEVLEVRPAAGIADEVIATAIGRLTGDIDQVPSAVSAIKVGGVRAYARVRAGEDVQLAARPVTVERFHVLRRRDDALDVVVSCSSGTYIRALARDLGEVLGCGGHLTALRRTRVGSFTVAQAHTLEELGEQLTLLALGDAVAAMFTRREVDAAAADDIRHGRPLPPTGVGDPVGVFDSSGQVLALVQDTDGLAKPLVVLHPAS